MFARFASVRGRGEMGPIPPIQERTLAIVHSGHVHGMPRKLEEKNPPMASRRWKTRALAHDSDDDKAPGIGGSREAFRGDAGSPNAH